MTDSEEATLAALAAQLGDRSRALMGAAVSVCDDDTRSALRDALNMGGNPQVVVTLLHNSQVHVELSVHLGAARVPFHEGTFEVPMPGAATPLN